MKRLQAGAVTRDRSSDSALSFSMTKAGKVWAFPNPKEPPPPPPPPTAAAPGKICLQIVWLTVKDTQRFVFIDRWVIFQEEAQKA